MLLPFQYGTPERSVRALQGCGGGIGWVGGESAPDRRTGAVGGVCGAEQVIEKWRVGEVGDEQGYECVSRGTREVWDTYEMEVAEDKRTGNGEVGVEELWG